MSVEEFSGIGFAPGVVRGVRSFHIDKLGRLTGVVHHQVWRPGENGAECRKEEDPYPRGITINGVLGSLGATYSFVPSTWGMGTPSSSPATIQVIPDAKVGQQSLPAVVSEPSGPVPKPPHKFGDCTCGFYGYYDGSNDYRDEDRVNGVVEGYGETVIGTRGFRAMKARIVALHIPDSVRDQYVSFVARNYKDIPFFSSFKDMVAEFPPDGGELAVTPETDPDFWDRSI